MPRKRSFLLARDIAEEMGVSRVAASRLLARLEEEHGPTVVGRMPSPGGFARYVTRKALRKITPLGGPSEDLEDRVKALEDRLDKLEDIVT